MQKTDASSVLSLVISGRNDNHNGDFDLRAEYAIKHNTALLNSLSIPLEIVWVEWNPLPHTPLFASKLQLWHHNVKSFVVTPEIHNHVCDNPGIGVMQFHAKNTGIRRAQGEWILSMNADTYLTKEVLLPLSSDKLDPDLFHIATRIDFHSLHLETPPSEYPIRNFGERNTTLVSKIDIPRSFGSVGDFSLLHRKQWMKLQGHFEGVRFSNLHLDTLLCRKWIELGGSFHELGSIYHADHGDSWNNFSLGDDKKHHGSNYNYNLIEKLYANQANWGLSDFEEVSDHDSISTLLPPPGLQLRSEAPAQIIIPEKLSSLSRYTETFLKSINQLRDSSAKVIIYGLGDQVRQAIKKGLLDDLTILGYVDDSNKIDSELPLKQLTIAETIHAAPDALLIGSLFWADQLREKASAWMPIDKIYPKPDLT